MTTHGFCTLHRIGYNRRLDPTCPQCVNQRIMPPDQLDYDPVARTPLEKTTGKPLDAFSLEPVV